MCKHAASDTTWVFKVTCGTAPAQYFWKICRSAEPPAPYLRLAAEICLGLQSFGRHVCTYSWTRKESSPPQLRCPLTICKTPFFAPGDPPGRALRGWRPPGALRGAASRLRLGSAPSDNFTPWIQPQFLPSFDDGGWRLLVGYS